MAWRRECRGKKYNFSTRALGPAEFGDIMGRGRNQAARADSAWPKAAAQMHAGMQGCRQPGIASDHQRQMPDPAEGRDPLAQAGAINGVVVPEDDAGVEFGQSGDGRQRVGQAFRIREQP